MAIKIDQTLIVNFRSELGQAGDDPTKLRAVATKIDAVIDELRRSRTVDMNADVHQLLALQPYADSRLFTVLASLTTPPATRFNNLAPATRIDTGRKNSDGIDFQMQRDAGGYYLSTSPTSVGRFESTLESMVVTDNAQGGKDLRLPNGQQFTGAEWRKVKLSDILPRDERYKQLEQSGINMDFPRDVLVLSNNGDKEPMIALGTSQWGNLSVTVVCDKVQTFGFDSGGQGTLEKPVVYLYPTSIQDVRVEVRVDGEFSCQYPKADDGVWKVKAGPNGEIFEPKTERRFPYLFWESKSCNLRIDAAQSHCIARKDAETFLEHAARCYAFNDRERTDFVSYWLPALEANTHTMVQFLTPVEYARYADMTITPIPDTLIRLFMLVKPLAQPVAVGSPALPTHRRKGFTVVEWGGARV